MVHRPAGFPREFERRLTLADGRSVLVRPVVPGDADALVHAIRTADHETLRRRFLGAPPPIDRATVQYLVTVDYVRRFALVAFGDGRGVAIARYEPMPDKPGVAEVAVAVDPPWRRVGLATALVSMLAEAAAARGVTQFEATYLASNEEVAAIVHDLGVRHRAALEGGVVDDLLLLPTAAEDSDDERLESGGRVTFSIDGHGVRRLAEPKPGHLKRQEVDR